MHWELPEYGTFAALLKFVNKYIKVLRNLRRSPAKAAAHIVDEKAGDRMPPLETEDEDLEQAELIERLLATDDVEEQVGILAAMQKRGFRARTRRRGGPRRPHIATRAAAYMPLCDRRDLDRGVSCISCGSKTHGTRDCKEGQRAKTD